jgi:Ca2+/Na+ antiporter
MVLGIMFPVGLSQIMSFSFTDVENDKFVDRYRDQIVAIRNVFVILFVIATVVIFVHETLKYKFEWKIIKFNTDSLCLVYFVFCLLYFIINFVRLSELKNEIEDIIRKDKQTKMEASKKVGSISL